MSYEIIKGEDLGRNSIGPKEDKWYSLIKFCFYFYFWWGQSYQLTGRLNMVERKEQDAQKCDDKITLVSERRVKVQTVFQSCVLVQTVLRSKLCFGLFFLWDHSS